MQRMWDGRGVIRRDHLHGRDIILVSDGFKTALTLRSGHTISQAHQNNRQDYRRRHIFQMCEGGGPDHVHSR